MKTLILSAALISASLVALHQESIAEEHHLTLTVSAGKTPRQATPVKYVVQIPSTWEKGGHVTLTGRTGEAVAGQLVPGIDILGVAGKPARGMMFATIHFLLPELAAGENSKYDVKISSEPPKLAAETFAWKDTSGQFSDLTFAGRPVLRYMYEALDESSKEARSATSKPYHHVFDPKGKILLTKGPGGLFPHHRGVFYGFNRISYGDGKKADVWHCNKGEFQSHKEFVSSDGGPVLGRHVCRIAWHGQDKQVFAEELRELTAYNTPGGTLIEFASHLESKVGNLRLDGDPQHAGFQFRATQEVPDKTAKLTYYLRPDGKGEPGKFRNWDAKTRDPKTVNLPWHALSFVVGDQRYTCCYLDRPDNPKEARFSERDYGRFGSYFQYELYEGKPLDVSYRLWLQEGEMTGEQVQRLADDFVKPVKVTQE